jgi:hypothetical protein
MRCRMSLKRWSKGGFRGVWRLFLRDMSVYEVIDNREMDHWRKKNDPVLYFSRKVATLTYFRINI